MGSCFATTSATTANQTGSQNHSLVTKLSALSDSTTNIQYLSNILVSGLGLTCIWRSKSILKELILLFHILFPDIKLTMSGLVAAPLPWPRICAALSTLILRWVTEVPGRRAKAELPAFSCRLSTCLVTLDILRWNFVFAQGKSQFKMTYKSLHNTVS